MKHHYRQRDLVVYCKDKHGTHPGPRAHDVRPARSGETYRYVVDKYWIVDEVRDDGTLVLRTPGGKLHEVAPDDPHLRRPSWGERLWLRWAHRERLRALLEGRARVLVEDEELA